jgi:hypothetical protein
VLPVAPVDTGTTSATFPLRTRKSTWRPFAHLDVVARVARAGDLGALELAPDACVDRPRARQTVELLERGDRIQVVQAVVAVHTAEREVQLVEPPVELVHARAGGTRPERRQEDDPLERAPRREVARLRLQRHADAVRAGAPGCEVDPRPTAEGAFGHDPASSRDPHGDKPLQPTDVRGRTARAAVRAAPSR